MSNNDAQQRGSSSSKRRSKGRKSNGRNTNASKGSQPAFEGQCKELKGKIFDIGPSQASQFIKTKEAIIGYAWTKYSPEVAKAIQQMRCMKYLYQEPVEPAPKGADGKMTSMQMESIKFEVRRYMMKKEKYDEDLKSVFRVILDQCTDALKQQLEADEQYAAVAITSNAFLLMGLIQRLCYSYRAEMYPPASAIRALKSLVLTRQGEQTTNIEWMEQFTSLRQCYVDSTATILF